MNHDSRNLGSPSPALPTVASEISRICAEITSATALTVPLCPDDHLHSTDACSGGTSIGAPIPHMDEVVRQRSARSYVTFTTTSGIDAIQIAIGMMKRKTPFTVATVSAHIGAKPLFDLRANPLDGPDVFDTMRSLLNTLSLAAERGALMDFEVVHGAYLLDTPNA